MQGNNLSFTERLSGRFLTWLWENKVPFFSSLIFGLIAHMFVITNKLPNHDDVIYLFGKGATVSSGRWGLELLRQVIPDYSMPWLHGITSLLLLSVSICIIVELFSAEKPPRSASALSPDHQLSLPGRHLLLHVHQQLLRRCVSPLRPSRPGGCEG